MPLVKSSGKGRHLKKNSLSMPNLAYSFAKGWRVSSCFSFTTSYVSIDPKAHGHLHP